MIQKFALMLFLGMLAGAQAAVESDNLVPNGDFEANAVVLTKTFKASKGKLTFIQEQPGRNGCAKLEIVQIRTDQNGQESAHAQLQFTLNNLKPDTTYGISFDLTGTAPRFMLNVNTQEKKKINLTMTTPPQKKGSAYLETGTDWTQYAGKFKTVDAGTYKITISLWHNTKYGKMFYSVGDYILVDNITVHEK